MEGGRRRGGAEEGEGGGGGGGMCWLTRTQLLISGYWVATHRTNFSPRPKRLSILIIILVVDCQMPFAGQLTKVLASYTKV